MGIPTTTLIAVIGTLILLILILKFYYRTDVVELYRARDASGADTTDRVDLMNADFEPPYATTPIMSVDDYEYNLVFDQESNRAMTKATREFLMNQYPTDWSNQPPSSIHFQNGKAAMLEKFANPEPQPVGNPYKAIEGANLVPPDLQGLEQKERDLLQTYKPTLPAPMSYDLNEAEQLVKRIYDQKGKVAEVRKVTGQDNVFEVYSARNKNEPVQYEDEQPASGPAAASSVPVQEAGEATIQIPPALNPTSSALDPFFTVEPSSRVGRWDYTRWTPGLERSFAPTLPQTNWY